MKKIIAAIAALAMLTIYASNIAVAGEWNIPDLSEFERNDYIVYENKDSASAELVVLFDEENSGLCVVAESNEQSRTPKIFAYTGGLSAAVSPFERPKLTVNTDGAVYAIKYTAQDGAWVNAGGSYDKLLCDNLGEIIDTNIFIVEKLYKPYEFNHMGATQFGSFCNTGKNVAKGYLEREGNDKKGYIAFSDDGFNYDIKTELPEKHGAFAYIVYGNGVYVAVGAPEFDLMVTREYTWSNNSKIMYVINDDFEVIHSEALMCKRYCAGFYDGYFYFSDLNEEGTIYKKSSNGIDFEIIDADEFNGVVENIGNESVKTEFGYTYKLENNAPVLSRNNIDYPIIYENSEYAYAYQRPLYGSVWDSMIISKDESKRFLTVDGVYPIMPAPVMKDESTALRFRVGDYIYINIDSTSFYRIDISDFNTAAYVCLNGKILGFEQPPVIESDRTLVPMRFLFEQMGASVEWNGKTKTAVASLGNTSVSFTVDNTTATVNGETVTMDVPARIINDKTLVPLRFLSEELGFNVDWDDASRTAAITAQ